jgi:hypothetical protein
MFMFKAQSQGSSRQQDSGTPRIDAVKVGFRASAPVIIVVQDGSAWVMGQQGEVHTLKAPSVVGWDTGEWVAYGHDGPGEILDFWAPRVSETGFHPCGPEDAEPGSPPSRGGG